MKPPGSTTPHHTVLSLRVTGGFLGGASLELVDGLNCFIGGRGAGKTTALEFLRFGLGAMPDPRVNQQRYKALDSLIKANLGGGRISIELKTKTGMRYTAGRGVNENVQVLNEAGTAVPVMLDRDLIFGVDVFSQNQIEDIASDPTAQLVLLDRFQEEESATIARELVQLARQLEQSGIDLQRLDVEIDDLRAKASELVMIEERLKGFVEVGGPDAIRTNAAHIAKTARAKEERLPEILALALQKALRDMNSAGTAFSTIVEAQLDAAVRQGANREVFDIVDEDVRAFSRAFSANVASVATAGQELEARLKLHAKSLAERHALQEAEYRVLMSESEVQGGRAMERVALQASLSVALEAAKEQAAKQKQRSLLVASRNALLGRCSELRDQRYALRKRVAEEISRKFSTIRVTVTQASDLKQYEDLIIRSLKHAAVKVPTVAQHLSQVLLPTELSQIIASGDYLALAQRAHYDDDRAKKIVDAMSASGAAYAIETVDLEDRPCIELLDGKQYKESPKLSTGQRCTTILPILLVQSDRPLLIDQPEDNLDNAFVFDTIVTALKEVKGIRQVIFVTHNPNIPVLGQAERVFVFGSDGQHADLRQVGNVDECKDEIERILEGGKEAFLQRKTRYGY